MCCHYTMWRWVTMVHTTRATCGGRDRWGSCADASTDQVAAPALVCELLCGVRRTFLAHAAGPTVLHCNTTPRGTASTPAAVAQIGRASGCNPEGHRFNPCSLLPLLLLNAAVAPQHASTQRIATCIHGRDPLQLAHRCNHESVTCVLGTQGT